MERYYYKAKEGKDYLNLKTPLTKDELKDYTEITKDEFDELTAIPIYKPSEAELAKQEKLKVIAEKKVLLNKYREDVEQVSLFGMERDDYEEKKVLCKTLVEELRVLEQEVSNG